MWSVSVVSLTEVMKVVVNQIIYQPASQPRMSATVYTFSHKFYVRTCQFSASELAPLIKRLMANNQPTNQPAIIVLIVYKCIPLNHWVKGPVTEMHTCTLFHKSVSLSFVSAVFTTVSRDVSPHTSTAMFCWLTEFSMLYRAISRFLPRLLLQMFCTYNWKTHPYHCSRALFI